MEGKDLIMVAAIVIGPILAVQVQRMIDRIREKRNRRLSIFRTLMSTRAERLNREHVQSLNVIDIDFYGRKILGTQYQTSKERDVTNAWKNYMRHLDNIKAFSNIELWMQESQKLFIILLYKMSVALGYNFTEDQIRRDCYRPEAHNAIEQAQVEVLTGLVQVLRGDQSLPISIKKLPQAKTQEQSQ
jgi:hypothetical protein